MINAHCTEINQVSLLDKKEAKLHNRVLTRRLESVESRES